MSTSATLAEVAKKSPSAVSVLERHGLDYCCGGKQSFEDACREKNLDPQSILGEIDKAGPQAKDRDWQTASLESLVQHIVSTHHEYLKMELPVLGKRLAKVHEVHGPHDQENLDRMVEVYNDLRQEMEMHMHKEEEMLFPFIEQYSQAAEQGRPVPPVPFGSIRNPINVMELEHGSAGDALHELRQLTRNYELPDYACTTVQALYEGLKVLESDLHVHIHLENNILFPRAIAMER